MSRSDPYAEFQAPSDPYAEFAGAGQISPTLLASRQEASKREFESNLPESTIKSRAFEAARGILEPFDLHNVPGLLSSVGGAMYDALRGKGTAKAQQLVRAAITAPVLPVKNFAEGVAEGDYDKAAYGAGGILSQTVPAVTSTVSAVRSATPSFTAAPAGTAEELYRSALKAPTTMPPARVSAIVQTALKKELPISDEGIQRLNDLVEANDKAVESSIGPGSVSKYDVAANLKRSATKFATQVAPTKDLEAISQVGNDFLETQPAQIPNAAAQALKKGTYRQLADKYGEMGTAAVEAQKDLARGLMDELVKQFPEIKEVNADTGGMLDLRPVLQRAVNRAANANKGRLGPMIGIGVAKSLTGSTPVAVATGILKAVLDDPEMASKLAIAINKAQQKNPTKYGAPNITTAMGKVSALATALSGATTNADSSGTQ